MSLNERQQAALDAFTARKSFFLTGQAGTGKSLVLQNITNKAAEMRLTVGLTAMTGAAALLIGGKTLHSFLGIGLAEDPAPVIAKRVRVIKTLSQKWKGLNVLIVDEVSMLTGELLEKIDYVAKNVRSDPRPMGGIQTILSGDFYQLPPVRPGCSTTNFCFEAEIWSSVVPQVFELTEIMRQNDPQFQRCLSAIRQGSCPQDVESILRTRLGAVNSVHDTKSNSTIEPTKLYTRNADTDKINSTRLRELNLPLREFVATFSVTANPKSNSQQKVEKLKTFLNKSAPCQDTLRLCEGAQVMLTHNLDFEAGLVNGSRGVVKRFVNNVEGGYPVVRFLNGLEVTIENHSWTLKDEDSATKIVVAKSQLPLKLAYAITAHKSQGMSLDLVEIDIGHSVFEAGQAYVALSRVRTIDGLHILDFAPEKIRAHPKVKAFYQSIKD